MIPSNISNMSMAEIARSHEQAVSAIQEFVNASGNRTLDDIILKALSLPQVVSHTRNCGTSIWMWRSIISSAIRSYINHEGKEGKADHRNKGLFKLAIGKEVE